MKGECSKELRVPKYLTYSSGTLYLRNLNYDGEAKRAVTFGVKKEGEESISRACLVPAVGWHTGVQDSNRTTKALRRATKNVGLQHRPV